MTLRCIEELDEVIGGATVRVDSDGDGAVTDDCLDLERKSRCRVARRSVSESRVMLVVGGVGGVRRVGVLAFGVPIRAPMLVVGFWVVRGVRSGPIVVRRRGEPDRDWPMMVPPNCDDGLLDLVLGDGWLGAPLMVGGVEDTAGLLLIPGDGTLVLRRMPRVDVEGHDGCIDRLGVLGTLLGAMLRSEELPTGLLGVEIEGRCADWVLGVELGRRLLRENPLRKIGDELLLVLVLGRVLKDRFRLVIPPSRELPMDGLEMLGAREGAGREIALRLGAELDRVLPPELRCNIRPSTDEAINMASVTARAIMTDLASFFSLTINIA